MLQKKHFWINDLIFKVKKKKKEVSNRLLLIELKCCGGFFRLTYLLFFGLIKNLHLFYPNIKTLIARGKSTLQQKIPAMLF